MIVGAAAETFSVAELEAVCSPGSVTTTEYVPAKTGVPSQPLTPVRLPSATPVPLRTSTTDKPWPLALVTEEGEPCRMIRTRIVPFDVYTDESEPRTSVRRLLVGSVTAAPFENGAAGTVTDIGYLGTMSLYKVRLDDGLVLRAAVMNEQRQSARAVHVNDRVWLSWEPDAAVLLSD